MGRPVITVASGGRPVVDVTSVAPMMGLRVTEATNGFGMPVTKVAAGKFGLPVIYASAIGSGPAVTYTTWNGSDKANINLTNNNLTSTVAATGAGGVRAMTNYSSGKYYFEVTDNCVNTNSAFGFGLSSATLPTVGGGAGTVMLAKTNQITVNGSNIGIGCTHATGNIVGIAIDLTGKLIWFRVAPAGNWNNSGTANPATGTGGANISGISAGALYPLFDGAAVGETITANFGASAFSGAVPSGFTAGWPA